MTGWEAIGCFAIILLLIVGMLVLDALAFGVLYSVLAVLAGLIIARFILRELMPRRR